MIRQKVIWALSGTGFPKTRTVDQRGNVWSNLTSHFLDEKTEAVQIRWWSQCSLTVGQEQLSFLPTSSLWSLTKSGTHFSSIPTFFKTSLSEYNCFTLLCQFLLYNKVNQPNVYIYPHIPSLLRLPPTLPLPLLQVVTKHQADLPLLCSCFPLAIYFTFGSVYMSMPLSHFTPAYPSPPGVLKSLLYVWVFMPVLPLGSSESLFFQIPYVCVSIRFLFFSF